MPPVPEWFQRLPSILAELEAYPAPMLDRASLQKLFGVGRRTAVNLMARFGAEQQAGRTSLLSRMRLLKELRTEQSGDSVVYEQKRRERLVSLMDEARREVQRKRLEIKIDPRQQGVTFTSLPSKIEVRPRELRITFTDEEDLLTSLALFSRAMENDFPGLLRRIRPRV
jgi:hypothetical protein